MENCSPTTVPSVKGDKFSLDWFPKNDLEWDQMRDI